MNPLEYISNAGKEQFLLIGLVIAGLVILLMWLSHLADVWEGQGRHWMLTWMFIFVFTLLAFGFFYYEYSNDWAVLQQLWGAVRGLFG